MDHYAFLFVSTLADDMPPDCVADIARQARANNARTDITGLLVFDGENFAQLMEGPKDTVLPVAERMSHDPRHCGWEVLYEAEIATPRQFPTWRLGYLVMDLQEFGPKNLRGKRGPAALEAFDFMLPALDHAVGEAVPAKLLRRRDPA